MALTSTQLSIAPVSIFTSSGSNAITAVYLCNSGTQAVSFTIYAVPNGGSASALNAIYYSVPLTINDTYIIDTEKIILENGDALFANLNLASGGAVRVVATVSSIEV